MQTRNARKACPKGVPLPEWVVKSREIGTSLFDSVNFSVVQNSEFQIAIFSLGDLCRVEMLAFSLFEHIGDWSVPLYFSC